MGNTLVKKMTFRESISALSEFGSKWSVLIDNLKREYDSVTDALSAAEDDVRERENTIAERDSAYNELEESLEHLESRAAQGVESIYWKADNLLDQQVMERLAELLKTHGSLSVLRALETINI